MDDTHLVRVVDRAAHGDEQAQPLADRQAVFVAVDVDRLPRRRTP